MRKFKSQNKVKINLLNHIPKLTFDQFRHDEVKCTQKVTESAVTLIWQI